MNKMKSFSFNNCSFAVVIPARIEIKENRSSNSRLKLLIKCLESIIESININQKDGQLKWGMTNILLIDDSSSISLKDILPESITNKIEISKNYYSPGQAGSLNFAVTNSCYDVFAFTDSDCVVAQDWVNQIAYHFKNNSDHVGVSGPNWKFLSVQNKWAKFLTKQESSLMRYIFERYVNYQKEITWRVDCRNMALKKVIFDKNCLFPEKHGPGVSGQYSHYLRKFLKTNAMQIGFNDKMITYHQHIKSLIQQIKVYHKRGFEGRFHQLYKYGHKNIKEAFLSNYFYEHFIAPGNRGVFVFLYSFLVHSAFWLGIFQGNYTKRYI